MMRLNEEFKINQIFEVEEKERYWREFKAVGGSRDHFEEFWPGQWQAITRASGERPAGASAGKRRDVIYKVI